MNAHIVTALRPAVVMALLFALLLGIAYPLTLTGIGQILFPSQAGGSLVRDGGKVIGSAIVGQAFTSDRYFNSRPSAAGTGYDGLASSGSNLGPASRALANRVRADVRTWSAASAGRPIPSDLVTTSASGLDPDLSPQAAFFQAERVARARGLDPAMVHALVERQIERPLLGFIGEPRINLLDLNRRLDAIAAKQAR